MDEEAKRKNLLLFGELFLLGRQSLQPRVKVADQRGQFCLLYSQTTDESS